MVREDSNKDLHFQVQLLMNVKKMKHYPFTQMVIKYGLTEAEYLETIRLFEELEHTYEQDQENGLIDHSPLLIHFAGMLCYKLPVEGTIMAMYEEKIHPNLTDQLLKLIRI
ncbi:DUF1878 family protein [Halobacillus naozhouensis]|uniref:DUF1878 family protein n=1 Tax=Halobacillus naozhouensis TaxID=554880 RepID=A0ABY8J156_9BACI|nr:DUF1878 family protein [Halobacillus naozhouensis]WFT76075.1 DUF1878 family protein [Halobacillus naozhouensis]